MPNRSSLVGRHWFFLVFDFMLNWCSVYSTSKLAPNLVHRLPCEYQTIATKHLIAATWSGTCRSSSCTNTRTHVSERDVLSCRCKPPSYPAADEHGMHGRRNWWTRGSWKDGLPSAARACRHLLGEKAHTTASDRRIRPCLFRCPSRLVNVSED